jgi:formate dehydrogenase gamma subunit
MSEQEIAHHEQDRFLRFALEYRLEHWVFAISFIILGITGLIQKYFEFPLSLTLIELMGGIINVRVIHRVAATVMMISVVYHLGVVTYRIYVKRYRLSMLPSLADAINMVGWFLYNLGLKKERPQEGRYTYGEKMEYWAVVWGTVIMAVTGFMMWNPIATTNFLDGQWIPAAKAAHGAEAVLAVLAIIIWHLYNVLVKTLNKSMFTGYLTRHQMEHEHPLELADILAGTHEVPVDPIKAKARLSRFIPAYSIVGGLLLVGIVWFVSFEQTAIDTVPPLESVEVFAPLPPTPLPTLAPTPTPRPTPETSAGAVDWNNTVASMLEAKCGACHISAALGELNLGTYADLLAGGATGPAVVPGEPEDSLLVAVQEAGNHPGQLTDAELQIIIAWINAGAPESPEGSATGIRYQTQLLPVFTEACGACHGDAALGGLNLLSYTSALAGSASGPVILPEDPANSPLIAIMEAGDHPGKLTDEQLQLVRDWIAAGAPE